MKKSAFLLTFFLPFVIGAQEHKCARHKQNNMSAVISAGKSSAVAAQVSHELEYDVKFVHLDLHLERTNKYIEGGVKTVATVTVSAMDTFMTILHTNHTIDSIRFNGALLTAVRQDSMVKVKTPSTLGTGTSFTVNIFYHGTAPTGGSAIGSGFSNATSPSFGNQVTWSLSQAFVAYHWWPCKQILMDKIDSSWVFITTDSTNKAGSNGLLTNVVTQGSKKRFEWKSRYPIDYYLISIAVAKYKEYNLYAKPQYLVNDSILIQNYIYDAAITSSNWINNQKTELDKMPQVLKFLCDMYGMYPFLQEKYGHCMAPLGGGMEHQTMSTVGFFDYYINAHELGHQWWGDHVTCKTWADIWINEGFASYTEHLVAQYLDFSNFAGNLAAAHNNVMSSPGGSVRIPVLDTMKTSRIFSSRLTYDKGGAIIHSLRFVTNNDSLWFNTLRGFQNQYKNSVASAADFINYYQASTGINPSQFFNQWYYGEGFPTFNVKYNYTGNTFFLKSSQTVSMPSVTPLFVTPMEYGIKRAGKVDTIIRVMHSNTVENYSISLTGTVISVTCDPKNWIINQTVGPARDMTLGIDPNPNTDDLSELAFERLSIGPNPVQNFLTISNPGMANGMAQLLTLEGKLISETHLSSKTEIAFNSLSAGVYLLKIADHSGAERVTQKVIKE